MKGTHRTHAFDLISLIMIALLFLTFWQFGQNAGIVVVGAAEGRVAKAKQQVSAKAGNHWRLTCVKRSFVSQQKAWRKPILPANLISGRPPYIGYWQQQKRERREDYYGKTRDGYLADPVSNAGFVLLSSQELIINPNLNHASSLSDLKNRSENVTG
jgi:hypothetical protein